MARFSFGSTFRGSALVVGALIGMALGIWIAWAMRDFLSRQPFGRVLMTQVVGDKKNVEDAGFPVYPHKSRKFEIDWKQDEPPKKVVLHLRGFKLEAPLSAF